MPTQPVPAQPDPDRQPQLRHLLAGWLLSVLLLAAAATALISAARLVQPEEESLYSAEALIIGESQTGASGRWRTEVLTARGPATALSTHALPPAGSRVHLRAELMPNSAQTTAFLRARPQVISPPGPAWQLRARLRAQLTTASGTAHDGGHLLPGLVIGDVSGLPAQLSEDMRTVSLSHVTAVSGANITIVSLAVIALTAFLTRARWVGVSAALLVTAGYVFIVGPEPSVTRAAGMGLIGAVALLRGRRTPSTALLAAGIIAVLVYRPGLSSSVGFHLSVAATAALIVLGRPLTVLLMSWRIPHLLAAGLAVPIAAQAGVSPVLLGIDGTLSAFSILANALAAPAVAPATLLGMLALSCGLLPGAGWLAWLIAWPATLCAWWIAALAGFFASLPAAVLPWPAGVAGILLACLVLTGLSLLVIAHPLVRRIGACLLICALAAGLLTPVLRVPLPGDWQVMVCDVGQGSATLIALADREVLLIDTGEDEERIDACLDRAGAREVQLMISHFDADHYAGYPGAARGREITHIHLPAGAQEDPKARSMLADLPAAEVVLVQAGETYAAAGVRWQVLWPQAASGQSRKRSPSAADGAGGGAGSAGGGVRSAGGGAGAESGNDGSIVALLDVRGLRILVPGDLGARPQRRLASQVRAVDVLLAPHHGSADLDEGFYAAASPRLGIVSVGAENSYGHPSIRSLAAFGVSPVLRTDRCGSIVIDTTGRVRSRCPDFPLPAPKPAGGAGASVGPIG